MNDRAHSIAAPMDRAVMRPLHHGAHGPKGADADGQPEQIGCAPVANSGAKRQVIAPKIASVIEMK